MVVCNVDGGGVLLWLVLRIKKTLHLTLRLNNVLKIKLFIRNRNLDKSLNISLINGDKSLDTQ